MLFFVRLLLFLPMLSACGGITAPAEKAGDHVLLAPRYAKGFEIRQRGDVRQVVLHTPGQSSPRVVELPGQTQRVACLSTTHLAMFEAIHALDVVKAAGFADLVTDSSLSAAIRKRGIRNLTASDDLDREILLSVQPDILLTYPFQATDEAWCSSKGIAVLPVGEYLEEHPLGRAEWILLAGELAGRREEAERVFQAIEQRYLATRDQVRKSLLSTPPARVLFTSYEAGTWYAPPGNSAVATLLQDAGFHYLFEDQHRGGNIELSLEELLELSAQVSWWGALVRLPQDPDAEEFTQGHSALGRMPAIAAGHAFYCNTARTEYFGKALLEPDVLLSDLAAIRLGKSPEEHSPAYFHRITEKK